MQDIPSIFFPNLNEGKANAVVYRYGVPILWKEATRCSCWNMDSGSPVYNCAACHGEGYVYSTPTSDFAVVQNITFSKDFTPFGEWQSGDCTVTVSRLRPVSGSGVILNGVDIADSILMPNNPNPVGWQSNPVFDIGDFDLIILQNTTFKSSELLTMGTSMYGRQADTLRNPEGVTVKYVQTCNPTTGAVTVYTPGVDYNVVQTPAGYQIQWLIGTGAKNPGAGNLYSVVYRHNPVFQVFTQLPQNRDQDGIHFPRKVMARYRAVMGTNGAVM
jgi:hypothetical protein